MIVVQPTCGLCNYFRVFLSYYRKAIQNNDKLVVIWRKTEECPGYFLDYFEGIANIVFFMRNNKNYKITYRGFSTCPNFLPDYNFLKLKKSMLDKIRNNVKLLENNYDAIHIRRTDHIQMAKKFNRFTSDEDFMNFIDKSMAKYLYIATDNRETQDIFMKKYGYKIKVIKLIDKSRSKKLRKTGLDDAIIDLYMCAYARNFMGSGFSSYSDTIRNLRKIELQRLD